MPPVTSTEKPDVPQVRFKVTRTKEPSIDAVDYDGRGGPEDDLCDAAEDRMLMDNNGATKKVNNMALYFPGEEEEEGQDITGRPQRLTDFVRQIGEYQSVSVGRQPAGADGKPKPGKPPTKLGTFMGVFLPCLQNIFGVLFFIRLTWIVGTAGIIEAFFVIFICCLVTFLTSISLSAIATNGVVPSGGPYYMISRNLGPELGGAVGVLFYLGTTIAAAMYIVGAIEILIMYIVPEAKIFSDINNCYRLFGTMQLLGMGLLVMAGMKVVSKFALPVAIVVVICLLFSFIGVFVKINGTDELQYCKVGGRGVNYVKYMRENPGAELPSCNKTELQKIYCDIGNATDAKYSQDTCDPFFWEHREEVKLESAITGLASGSITYNSKSRYLNKGQFISSDPADTDSITDEHPEEAVDRRRFYITADVATSFIILVGVFFPSCTGIMAGSNRSGDLQDPSKSIPTGTIAATCVTSFCYLAGTLLFGASVEGMFLRDKFGESANGALTISRLAVPHRLVILIGCYFSTTGAGLQSLTGAPRLLQAISLDGVLPVLSPFAKSTRFQEPMRAQLLTFAICEIGILIAQLESITALITQFFLMCYASVNAACALQSILGAPGWRPRFKYYHWSMSLLGAVMCVAVMFISHWWFALVAIAIGAIVYKYIQYRGAEKEWGDGIRGLGLSAARYALLNLNEAPQHTKNWRPQVLVLTSYDPQEKLLKHPKLLAFASQLKAGKGLTVVATVIQGSLRRNKLEVTEAKEIIRDAAKLYKIKGFTEVLACDNAGEGLSALIQTSGLGGLKHNTVLIAWPSRWNAGGEDATKKVETFVEVIKTTRAARCALLVAKNIDVYPDSNEKLTGYIDVWWIVHDGGMLLLLPFLLQLHRVWAKCHLRLFTVAQIEDNSIKMKEDLRRLLYNLRINAEITVVEMPDSDISDYTYERTLMMEQRSQMLKELRLSAKERVNEVQQLYDQQHMIRKMSQKMTAPPPTLTEENEEVIQIEAPIEVDDASSNDVSLNASVDRRGSHDSRRAPKPVSGKVVGFASNVTSETFEEEDDDGEDEDGEGGEEMADEELSREESAELEDKVPETLDQAPHCNSAGNTFPPQNKKKMSFNSIVRDRAQQWKESHSPQRDLEEYNVHRMHTAVKVNEAMRQHSSQARLVVVNLPGPPRRPASEHYMDFIEALCEGLDRVLMVRGAGFEVVTMYS